MTKRHLIHTTLLGLLMLILVACNNTNEQRAHDYSLSGNEHATDIKPPDYERAGNATDVNSPEYSPHDNEQARDNNSAEQATNIKATSTSLSSKQYPHRRPIKQHTNNVRDDVVANDVRNQMQQPLTPANDQKQTRTENVGPAGLSDLEAKVIELTNNERKKNGLAALQIDTNLSNVARKKSIDMQQNNYFSHTSPTYGSPFDMMRDFGVTYKTAGENIAKGQQTAEQVVNAWMNSEGHRKNILNGQFTHIGVGFGENGAYWTQMFVGR